MSPTRRPGDVIGDDLDGSNGSFTASMAASLAADVALLPVQSPGAAAATDPQVQPAQQDGGMAGIHDVVFVDSRIPDIQDLRNGLKPGEQAFVIDSGSDGLDQVAAILKSGHFTGLTGIQIVSHGSSGALELGATTLNDSDLSVHGNALAQIGASLAPGADLSLYACDTAAGATGQQFITDLSHLAGVDVAAATHPVGSPDLGASWTLDASTGPVSPAETGAPFTDAALSAYDHVLSAQADAIFVTSYFNPGDPRGVTQSNAATPNNNATLTNLGAPLITPSFIALDPAHNRYFVVDFENEGSTGVEQAIYVGAIAGTLDGTNKLQKIFTLPATTNDLLTGVAFDPGSNTLYFSQQGSAEYDPVHPTATPLNQLSGIFSLNLNNLSLGSTLPEALVAYGANLGGLQGIALDTANHRLFFVDDSSGSDHTLFSFFSNTTPTNNIYEASIGSSPSLATSILQLPASETLSGYAQGFLSGIAYDPANQKLYFTTWDQNQQGAASSGVDAVFGEAVPAPGTTTLPAPLYTNAGAAKPLDVRVDAGSGQLFILNQSSVHPGGTSNVSIGSVLQGSISGLALTPVFTPAPTSPTSEIFGFAIDPAPILTTSGGTVNYAPGQSAVPIDAGLTIATPSIPGENLVGATVTISGGLDSSHDVLGFASQNGISIAGNGGGVLILTGLASVAAYQAALESVTFSTTSASAAQRSISFTVTDGVVTSAAASSDVVNILTPPVANSDSNAATVGATASGNVLGNDTDASGFTLSVSGFTDGGSGTVGTLFHGTYGDLTLNSNGGYTYSAGATVGERSALAGAPTGSHPTEIITYTVSDGHGSTASSTLTITLDRAPASNDITGNVVAGTSTQTFTAGSAGTGALHGDTDPDGDTPVITQVRANAGSAAALAQDGAQHSFAGSYGTLSIADDGSYKYTVNSNIASPTGSHPVDSFTLTIGDNGGAATAPETLAFSIDRAPTLTLNVAQENYTTLAAPVALQSAVTLSDPDGGDALAGATITVTGGYAGDGDLLSYHGNLGTVTLGDGSQYNVAYSGAGSSETLTITTFSGAATQADYIQLLDGVVFSSSSADPTNAGANPTRSVNFQLTDAGGAVSAVAGTESLNIEGPPKVTAGATAVFTGGGAAQPLDSGLTLSDPSSATLESATVSIEAATFLSGDTLSFATQNGISGSYNAATGLLSLTGHASVTDYQTALESVSYSFNPANGDPTGGGAHAGRTVDWTINDGRLDSAVATSTVETLHVPPTVTAGATATFHGGGAPVTLDSGLSVSDVDSSGNLVGASAQIIGHISGDTLNFTDTAHIHGSYNAATGVLSLSGTDTVADYQAALQSVSYSFVGNGDPTAGGGATSRSIYWVVNDGNTVNGSNETQPAVAPVNNDQPSLGLQQVVVENGIFPAHDGEPLADLGGIPLGALYTFAGTFGLGGTAAGQLLPIASNIPLFSILGTNYGGNGSSNFALPNLQGALAVGNPNAIGQAFGSDNVTLTPANLPARWGGTDVPFSNDQASQNVNYIINSGGVDFGSDALGTVLPFLGNFAPNGYMLAQGQLLNISDYPALFGVIGTTYGGDGLTTFRLPDLTGRTIIGAGSDGATTVALGATTGQDVTALATSNLPFPEGSDQSISNAQPSIALTYLIQMFGVFPSRDTIPPGNFPFTGQIIAFAGSGAALTNMLDNGWALANGQLLGISQYEPLFAVLNNSYGGNGFQTFALPDLVGRAVAGTGTHNGSAPVTLGEQFGSSTINLSASQTPLPVVATSTLDIVHTPPTVTAGATTAYGLSGAAVALDAALTVTDPDSGGNLTGATVNIGGFVAGDVLHFVNQHNIAGSYNAGVLTLSGTDTVADYQAALDSITFSSSVASAGSRTITWSVADGSSSNGSGTATSTLNVVDAPVINSVTAATTGNLTDLDAGKVVTIAVGFDRLVSVTGTPTLQLNDGEVATYSGETNGNTLNFSYTVQPGDNTADLRVQSLLLNGGTIQDGTGHDAVLSNAPTDLHLQVDTTAPTISVAANQSSLLAGQTATVTFTFSESVPGFVLGDAAVSGGALSNLVHVGINGSSQDIYTATFTPGASNSEAGSVQVTAASYTDAAGNTGAASNILSFTGDTLAPTVTVSADHTALRAGQTATVTFTFSEAVTGFALADTTVGGGALSNLVHVGINGSHQDIYTATFTPTATNIETGSVQVTASSYTDTAGNAGAASNLVGFTGDTLAPTASAALAPATLLAGQTSVATFTFSEAIAAFALADAAVSGGALSNLVHVGLNGFNQDVYTATFTPAAANTEAGSVQVIASTYTDVAGNAGAASNTAAVTGDTLAPSVASITTSGTGISNGNGDLQAGRVVTFTVNESEAVNVNTAGGAPTLTLNDGGVATYVGGSGSSALTFSYTVASGDNTADLAVNQIVLNGATIQDLAGNTATLPGSAINPAGTLQIDTIAPAITAVTAIPSNGIEGVGQTISIVLAFGESVAVLGGTPTLALNDNGIATYDAAATAALHDATKLVFHYTVSSSDTATSPLAVTGITLHGAAIDDLAGNVANLANVAATFTGLGVDTSLVIANPDSNHVLANQTVTADAAHGVLANDTDSNPADHLTVSAVDGLAGGANQPVAGAYGSLTLHADGSYAYTANNNASGVVFDNFTYTASNGHSAPSTSTLSVEVVGGNQNFVFVPAGGVATGGYGNTVLDGSAGHATLTAAVTLNSHQILIGGDGDVLNAASYGQDTFVFANNFGHETINNFQPALDVIELQQSQFGSLANVLADIHQVGADSVLTLDANHVITIAGIQHTSLSAADFHLV